MLIQTMLFNRERERAISTGVVALVALLFSWSHSPQQSGVLTRAGRRNFLLPIALAKEKEREREARGKPLAHSPGERKREREREAGKERKKESEPISLLARIRNAGIGP